MPYEFVGCKKAKEVSLTKDPANPRAVMLVAKTRDSAPENDPEPSNNVQTETDDMDIEVAKRIAGMNDVTRTHFAGLEAEAAKTFLAKSVEDQDKEAAEAKKAKDEAAAALAASEEAKKTQAGATEEAVKSLNTRVEELTKTLEQERRERDIEKMAAEARFVGYPGGEAEVKKALETAYSVDGDARALIITQIEDRAKSAKLMGGELGSRTQHDISRSHPKGSEVQQEAAKRAEAAGTTVQAELVKMAKEPAWKAKIGEALNEEMA